MPKKSEKKPVKRKTVVQRICEISREIEWVEQNQERSLNGALKVAYGTVAGLRQRLKGEKDKGRKQETSNVIKSWGRHIKGYKEQLAEVDAKKRKLQVELARIMK